MFADPTFWVLVALIIFLAIVWKVGGFTAFGNMLSSHGEKIAAELDEARQLKEEAQALLADYQQKQKDAQEQASEIVKQAEADAKRITKEAEEAVEDLISRRTKMVEVKIAQAEQSALKEVRLVAGQAAIEAVQAIAEKKLAGDSGNALIIDGIKEVEKNLN